MVQQESAREEQFENFDASDKDYSYDSEEESAPVTQGTTNTNTSRKNPSQKEVKYINSKFDSFVDEFWD